MTQHAHYKKDVSHLKTIDVYRVLDIFNVTSPAIQHAVKKLLCAGQRGAKDYERDLREAVDSINRALQMIDEDRNKGQRGWPERVSSNDQGDWIHWPGGECPVPDEAFVEVRYRNGTFEKGDPEYFEWVHDDNRAYDIVAYRIVGPAC